ncbi:hypothetical protein EZS27_044074 [termite gut metagenome]|uniref:Uncharacterized protein n=1 Tax=termite gut metagenome TaxID=433724 RepID=A0A5J4P5E7_9ZZZZ
MLFYLHDINLTSQIYTIFPFENSTKLVNKYYICRNLTTNPPPAAIFIDNFVAEFTSFVATSYAVGSMSAFAPSL